MRNNIILQTDSYKLSHWKMDPYDVKNKFLYMEFRKGGEYPFARFFGLQYILKEYLEGVRVTSTGIHEALNFANDHFGNRGVFNLDGWYHILEKHNGRLPVRISAVPEGMVIPEGNVVMTIEATDPHCAWLPGVLEGLLMKVWYPTTVATISYDLLEFFRSVKCANPEFMLQDFGYRGVSSEESAAIGGAAHLINFSGSDTISGIRFLSQYYAGGMAGFSVPASEHGIMTLDGAQGEYRLAEDIMRAFPGQIVSIVADSYDYFAFVNKIIKLKNTIDHLKVKLVIRPDSIVPPDYMNPADVVMKTLRMLPTVGKDNHGRALTCYKVLWGDGISPSDIKDITNCANSWGYSPDNLVFGMGGGLLQKVNRDTLRSAIKVSSVLRGNNGETKWIDVTKTPKDLTKASKAGRITLKVEPNGERRTVRESMAMASENLLTPVFEDGIILRQQTLKDIRERR